MLFGFFRLILGFLSILNFFLIVSGRAGNLDETASLKQHAEEVTTKPTILDSATVIQEKCDEYAKARFRNVTREGVLLGDSAFVIRELDCVQENPQKAGVSPVKEKEYPHLALLGSGEKFEDVKWFGTGSLISERFVLGAASQEKSINWVALGVLNNNITASDLDKNVFKIISTFIHPEYEAPSAYNDIALYELEKPLTFTAYLRPACLPTSEDIPLAVVNKATIAGWGEVDSDDAVSKGVLQKGKIDFVQNAQCFERYSTDVNLKRGFDNQTMLCAGNLIGDDISCVAEKGGPLQIPIPFKPCLWLQVGISSYDSLVCDDNAVTIYTKVSKYLDWIRNIVWP